MSGFKAWVKGEVIVKDTVLQGVEHPQATVALSGPLLPSEQRDSWPHSPGGPWWDQVSMSGLRELVISGAIRCHSVPCQPLRAQCLDSACETKDIIYVLYIGSISILESKLERALV